MEVDDFLTELFSNLTDSDENLNNIKMAVKNNIEFDYDSVKIEPQLLTENNNFDINLCVTNDCYDDGEIVFMDYRLEDADKLKNAFKEGTY